MKILCENCQDLVVEGEKKMRDKKRGGNKFIFELSSKPLGTIIKNNSNNPDDWKGLCSKCQKEKDKNKLNKKNNVE